MKRSENNGKGMAAMKEGHWEKDPGCPYPAGGKYSKSEMGNPEELKESVNKLSSYVKNHRMKY